MFDTVKDQYQQISVAHNRYLLAEYKGGDAPYHRFLDELGSILFSEPPYVFDHGDHPVISTHQTYLDLQTAIKSPNLDHLLCKGSSLNLDRQYIVITTKIRGLASSVFNSLSSEFWSALQQLSTKYKIVVIGERNIEPNREYQNPAVMISSIYDQIIRIVKPENLLDLTVPGFGITAPNLNQIRQDCLIMKEAKLVITFGIGGNVWMSSAVANTIGFRADNEGIIDCVVKPEFQNIFITKDWNAFMAGLASYK